MLLVKIENSTVYVECFKILYYIASDPTPNDAASDYIDKKNAYTVSPTNMD
jgi:hypothetical protein